MKINHQEPTFICKIKGEITLSACHDHYFQVMQKKKRAHASRVLCKRENKIKEGRPRTVPPPEEKSKGRPQKRGI